MGWPVAKTRETQARSAASHMSTSSSQRRSRKSSGPMLVARMEARNAEIRERRAPACPRLSPSGTSFLDGTSVLYDFLYCQGSMDVPTRMVSAASHDEPPTSHTRRADDPAACRHCGAPVELLNVLPRRGDQPEFRIFGCTSCTLIEWLAQ